MESLHHSASLEDVAGTVLFPVSHGAFMVLLDQPLFPLHHLPQLPSRHQSGTAHLRQTFASGTTRKKMNSTGRDPKVAHHQLELVPLQITQQEAKKVRIEL